MRLFIGIPLPAAVVDQLTSVSLRLRSKDDGLRWSAPESWHIALQFLGSVTDEQYACIRPRLGELQFSPVPIQLTELGFFDRAGVFFADVALTPELLAIQQRVCAATSDCGFAPEDRPYHPHITLARSKGKYAKQALQKLKSSVRVQPRFRGFSANEIVLYQSLLKPTGSQYIIRERFPSAR